LHIAFSNPLTADLGLGVTHRKRKRGKMTNDTKVKGPASYFPSIEKTYGKPVSHWFAILKSAGELKHMELVNLLKTDYKIGHGHASALVTYHVKNQ
jgi:hypothetical protein